MVILILRLGHRIARDKRITTHLCLAARAFGASGVILSGERDERVMESVRKVVKKWGGKFSVTYEKRWKEVIRKFKNGFKVVHLTMYGMPLEKEIKKIRKAGKEAGLLVVVGGEKVPGDVFKLSDYNVAITNQPHSEVSALAVFLYAYFHGKPPEKFTGAKIRILPSKDSKRVVRSED